MTKQTQPNNVPEFKMASDKSSVGPVDDPEITQENIKGSEKHIY